MTANIIRYLSLILLIIIQPDRLFSSDIEKSHKISIYSGVSGTIERDDASSPFIYRGYSLPIELGYRHNRPRSRQIFYAKLEKGRQVSDLPDYNTAGLTHYVKSTDIHLGYSYLLRTFKIVKFKTEIFLGAEINALMNLRQHAYYNNNEFLMLDQFNSLGLRAQIEKKFASDKQSLVLSINVPALSYMLMGNIYNTYVGDKIDPLMNYPGNMLTYLSKKGDIVSFNKLICFKTDFTFTRNLSRNIGIELKHSLRYYKIRQYKETNFSKNFQNQFLAGVVFNF